MGSFVHKFGKGQHNFLFCQSNYAKKLPLSIIVILIVDHMTGWNVKGLSCCHESTNNYLQFPSSLQRSLFIRSGSCSRSADLN